MNWPSRQPWFGRNNTARKRTLSKPDDITSKWPDNTARLRTMISNNGRLHIIQTAFETARHALRAPPRGSGCGGGLLPGLQLQPCLEDGVRDAPTNPLGGRP